MLCMDAGVGTIRGLSLFLCGICPTDSKMLEDFCSQALNANPNAAVDGEEFVLACPPEVEADIYRQDDVPEACIHSHMPQLRSPTILMRGGNDIGKGRLKTATDPAIVTDFLHADALIGNVQMHKNSHMLLFEAPDAVVEQLFCLVRHVHQY